MLSSNGVIPDNKKIIVIQKITALTSISELKSFLGTANYINHYIPDFSTIADPLQQYMQTA